MGLDMFIENQNGEELAYWRKANHIHKWFSDHLGGKLGVMNCTRYRVTRKQLQKLKDICEIVLQNCELVPGRVIACMRYSEKINGMEPVFTEGRVIKDPSYAVELLPRMHGFFFGGQEYDSDYYYQVKDTIELIDKILKSEEHKDDGLFYVASW